MFAKYKILLNQEYRKIIKYYLYGQFERPRPTKP